MICADVSSKICIIDIIFLVIFDTCRSRLLGEEWAEDYSDTLLPDNAHRPPVSVLCASTSRNGKSYENPDISFTYSAFTHFLISEEQNSGLFSLNTPVRRALENACQMLREHSLKGKWKQDPTPMGLERIPGDFCLLREERPSIEYDICLCYRRDTDEEQAAFICDKLGLQDRNLKVFGPSADRDAGMEEDQIARAIAHSRIVVLVVSDKTFQGVDGFVAGSPCEGAFSRLLLQCELIVEMHGLDPTKFKVLPVCGVESNGATGKIFADVDPDALWPMDLPTCVVKSIATRAEALLRADGMHFAERLSTSNLQIESHSVVSLKKGRPLEATLLVLKRFAKHKLFGAKQVEGQRAAQHIISLLGSSASTTGKRTLESMGPEEGAAYKTQKILSDQLQVVASLLSSRSLSPGLSDTSQASTAPASPASPHGGPVLFGIHVSDDVKAFADRMREFMDGWLHGSGEQRRQWRLCELLLVAFMRNTASCDEELSKNLDTWQSWCDDPSENLFDCFHKMMVRKKPPSLEKIGFRFQPEARSNTSVSIFVIDWVVQRSPWALECEFKRDEWVEKVVKQWFEPESTETVDEFLDRAEKFLEVIVRGKGSWGAKILWKVIESNSFVFFLRMEGFNALLMREHCDLHAARDARKLTHEDEADPASKARYSLGMKIDLMVSSCGWSLSTSGSRGQADIPGIVCQLQRIASLPTQLLEANECAWSEIESVGSDLLHTLEGKMIGQSADDVTGIGNAEQCVYGRTSHKKPHAISGEHLDSLLEYIVQTSKHASKMENIRTDTTIETPIDLRTVKCQLASNLYEDDVDRFRRDVVLVFHNAQLCYSKDPDVLENMEELRADFEQKWIEMSTNSAAEAESQLKSLLKGQQSMLAEYIKMVKEEVGFYHDSASGEMLSVATESISLEASPTSSVADRCEDEMKCTFSDQLMHDPVKSFDGRMYKTYERAKIVEYFENCLRSHSDEDAEPVVLDPYTRRPLQLRRTEDGRFELELRPDEEMKRRIEELQRNIEEAEERQKMEAEGHEERCMMLRRMGLDDGNASSHTSSHMLPENSTIESADALLQRIVREGQTMCVIGAPASGKTLCMLQVACAAASKVEAWIEGQQDASQPLIPVFMRAAEFSALLDGREENIKSLNDLAEIFLRDRYKSRIEIAEVMTQVVRLHGALVLVDGLDEAQTDHRVLIEVCVDKACRDSQWVTVSSRESAFELSRKCCRLRRMAPVRMKGLDGTRRDQFIKKRMSSSPQSAEAFRAQLTLVAHQFPELESNPFMLALMIEVFKKDGNLPQKRTDLYERQVDGVVARHAAKDGKRQDSELFGKASSDFLQMLSYVCQVKLKKRDFQWDSDDVQTEMSGLSAKWTWASFPVADMARFLMGQSPVGLLSRVGDGVFRFSHLTLQEYLAARFLLRHFEHSPEEVVDGLRPLHDPWNRMVVQFAACMLSEEPFASFCGRVLECDEGDGVHCELVQDFLKERGGSERVEKMVREKVLEIRGTDYLIAGLCHPSMEMRNLVLSEMKSFGVPPDPFAPTDGTAARLRHVAQDSGKVWYTRCAAILSLAQIAKMDHCKRSDSRRETLAWLFEVFKSNEDDNITFALVKGVGTLLKGQGDENAHDESIAIGGEDEQFLVALLHGEDQKGALDQTAQMVADLKVYSNGLIDWILARPRLIQEGKWPGRHAVLMCSKVAKAGDHARASLLAQQLLGRLHASSEAEVKQARGTASEGLKELQELIAAHAPEFVLSLLARGRIQQRAQVLDLAAYLDLRFEGRHVHDLAACLLTDVVDSSMGFGIVPANRSLLAHLMDCYYYPSARTVSQYLQSKYLRAGVQSTADSSEWQRIVAWLTEFETCSHEQGRGEEEAEEEAERHDLVKKSVLTSMNRLGAGTMIMPGNALELTSLHRLKRVVNEFERMKLRTRDHTDTWYMFFAAKLWGMSGLMQDFTKEELVRSLRLRGTEYDGAEAAFNDFLNLKNEDLTEEGWKAAVEWMIHDMTIGSQVAFTILLNAIRNLRRTGQLNAEASKKLQGIKAIVEQWQVPELGAGVSRDHLECSVEKRFLCKELRIGRRAQELPTWQGIVDLVKDKRPSTSTGGRAWWCCVSICVQFLHCDIAIFLITSKAGCVIPKKGRVFGLSKIRLYLHWASGRHLVAAPVYSHEHFVVRLMLAWIGSRLFHH